MANRPRRSSASTAAATRVQAPPTPRRLAQVAALDGDALQHRRPRRRAPRGPRRAPHRRRGRRAPPSTCARASSASRRRGEATSLAAEPPPPRAAAGPAVQARLGHHRRRRRSSRRERAPPPRAPPPSPPAGLPRARVARRDAAAHRNAAASPIAGGVGVTPPAIMTSRRVRARQQRVAAAPRTRRTDDEADAGVLEVSRATGEVAWHMRIYGKACPTDDCGDAVERATRWPRTRRGRCTGRALLRRAAAAVAVARRDERDERRARGARARWRRRRSGRGALHGVRPRSNRAVAGRHAPRWTGATAGRRERHVHVQSALAPDGRERPVDVRRRVEPLELSTPPGNAPRRRALVRLRLCPR